MDSAKNRDNKNGHTQGQDWEDAAFSWDNMKEGIFQKIQEEDPQFFEKKRRRVAVWWWLGAAMLLVVGYVIWPNDEKKNTRQEETPELVAENKPAKAETPVTEKSIDQKQANPKVSKSIASANKTIPAPAINESSNNHSEKEVTKPAAFVQKIETGKTVTPALVQKNQNENISLNRNKTGDLANLPLMLLKPLEGKPVVRPSVPVITSATEEINVPKHDQKNSPWKIIAAGGPLVSFSKYGGTSDAVALRNEHTSPYFGYQYGLEAWKSLSEKSSLAFGVNRQVVYQNIDIYTQRAIDTLIENTVVHTTHYVVGDRTSNTYGDTLVTAVERNRLVKYNEFQFIKAHVAYARHFTYKKWHFAPSAGVALGMLTDSDGMSVAEDKSIFTFNQTQPVFNRFQFSTQAGMAIERQLGGKYSFHFQYRFGKQWNNLSSEPNMSLRPAFHIFSIGLARKW